MKSKDKNFIATYNGESFDFTFAGGSDRECKKSIISSMKYRFRYDEPSDKDIKIVKD